jgi:hypothetical protein
MRSGLIGESQGGGGRGLIWLPGALGVSGEAHIAGEQPERGWASSDQRGAQRAGVFKEEENARIAGLLSCSCSCFCRLCPPVLDIFFFVLSAFGSSFFFERSPEGAQSPHLNVFKDRLRAGRHGYVASTAAAT